jgi:hypothetical protein
MSKLNEAEDSFTDEEAQRRFEATLRGALSTPPKPLKEASAKARTPTRKPKEKQ